MGRRQDSGQTHPQTPGSPSFSPHLRSPLPSFSLSPSPFSFPGPSLLLPPPASSPFPTPLQFPLLLSLSSSHPPFLLPSLPPLSVFSLPRPTASPSPGSQKDLERQLSLRQKGVLKSQEGKTVKLNPRPSPRGWGWL